jgi:hypothetical protein
MRRKEQAEHGPYCSRCCKPLVFDYTPYFDADGGFHAGRYHCCPDGCASVAERWRLAFERAACGWAEYTHKCSRCGTNLLAPPWIDNPAVDSGRPEGFWCPGCGEIDYAKTKQNWRRAHA